MDGSDDNKTIRVTPCYAAIDDGQLVLAALIGNRDAFDELVRRYRGAVTLIATQILGTRDEAEDVAQDVFVVAFAALPQLADPTRFAPWLHAIARHRAARFGARKKRIVVPADPAEIDRVRDAQPVFESNENDRRDRVAEAVASLAPPIRNVVALFYFEDWPVARIAEFLSLPVTTVKWRLHAGREQLRRHLTYEEK